MRIGLMWTLLVTSFTVLAGGEQYYTQLLSEFKAAGNARLIAGSSEQEIAAAIQYGGGMERFYGESKHAPSLGRGAIGVNGQPFTKALQLRVDKKPATYWNKAFWLPCSKAVKKGEILLAVFWARGTKDPQVVDDGAGATLQAYFHSMAGKFHKGRVNNFYDCKMLTKDWQRYYIKSKPLGQDIPAKALSFKGMLGHKAQTVEVGGLAVLAFPPGSDASKLPRKSWNYAGRSPDAPWRKEAERRIDKYRRGNLTVKVVDQHGKAVPNANVQVSLKKHKFIFGTAVSIGTFHGRDRRGRKMSQSDIDKYREISSRYYNCVVAENQMKWVQFERERTKNWKRTKDCMRFYKEQGKWIRGHVLVWPSFFRTPKPLKDKFANTKLLREGVLQHIREEVNVYKDFVNDWDVTNETFVNRGYMDKLGPQSMIEWYKAAKEADPTCNLNFNEMRFGEAGFELGSFPEKMLKKDCRGWVDYLIRNGAPLDTIGAQCHGGAVEMTFAGKTGPEGLWAYFDYFSKYYGKKLQYTELDVRIGNIDDPDQVSYQADKFRDSIIIAFAHPAFIGVTQWGFWEGAHYAPTAALWRRDWSIRPVGKAYLDLVEKRWHTEKEMVTAQDGTCTTQAFYGDYQIQIGRKKAKSVNCQFPSGDKVVQVILPH